MRILPTVVLTIGILSMSIAQEKFISPIKSHNNVSRHFGEVRTSGPGVGKRHSGVDIEAAVGTPVFAASAGKVIQAETVRNYGTVVRIQHAKGIRTLYAHLSKLAVKKGQTVEQGTVIAYSGTSAQSPAPHLHYEVLVKGRSVDPGAYLH